MAPGPRPRHLRRPGARADPSVPGPRGAPAPEGLRSPTRDDRRGHGLRVAPRPADEAGIAAAIDALTRGRLVLHPTETVVSLSGDPWDGGAVAAALLVKGYSSPRPFLCLVPGVLEARSLCDGWPREAERLAAAFWPGPLTLVLPASSDAPIAVADAGRIAIRPAADPVSAALLAAWGRALFSTSANRRSEPPIRDVQAALDSLRRAPEGDAIEVALVPLAPTARAGSAGSAGSAGVPSTIVDAGVRPPRLLRVGAISADRIRDVVGELVEAVP